MSKEEMKFEQWWKDHKDDKFQYKRSEANAADQRADEDLWNLFKVVARTAYTAGWCAGVKDLRRTQGDAE